MVLHILAAAGAVSLDSSAIAEDALKAESQDNGSLHVSITGIRNQTGQLVIRLYDRADGFPRHAKSVREIRKVNPIRAGGIKVSFDDLPRGDYAVCVTHDEDRNGDMTYRFYLLPAEGYCFSRNFRPRFRAPSFEKVAVTLDQPERTIELQMRY